MHYQADQWRRARQLQLQIVRISVILIAGLTAALVLVILFPVRFALERREESEFGVRSQLVASEVENYFDQAVQLSLQLPSRTVIREELVAYLREERTLQSYIDFTQPKLQDAVDASPGMVAAFRYGPDGEPLTGAYVDPDQLPEVRVDASEPVVIPGTKTIHETLVILVQVPIDHGGYGRAGFDIVAVSVEPLRVTICSSAENMREATVTVAAFDGTRTNVAITSAEEARVEEMWLPMLAVVIPETDDQPVRQARFEIDGVARVGASDRFRSSWYVVVHQSESVLFDSVRSDTRVFLLVVILIGLSSVVVAGLVLGLLSRRTLAETGQLTRIVDEQTEQLELLLKEVHHRVKNDIMLMNSFLSLKAFDAEAPEAREALAEAQNTLLTMGRVYELLHRSGEYGSVSLQPLIEGLVDQARSTSDESHLVIEQSVHDVNVDRKTAIPLAIIANELLTNAVKYGGREREIVRVRIALDEDARDGMTLTVSDDGVAFGRTILNGEYGFGLRMVQALTDQLGGEMTISNDPEPNVTIRVPEGR